MRRRQVLALAAGGALAGCSGSNDPASPRTTRETTSQVTQSTASSEPSPATETPRQQPNTLFVDADAGDDSASGSRDDPLATVQAALDRARPGETVSLESGEYRQSFQTRRHGRPDEPITLTGPPEAIIRGGDEPYDGVFTIKHHHVHVRGCTFDGLWRPSAPDDPESYRRLLIHVAGQSNTTGSEYLRDIRVAPHAVGNAQGFVNLSMVTDAEVGPFRVAGLAGKSYTVGDAEHHAGEIVYVGSAPTQFERSDTPIDGPDETHDVRIHHIDNSEGYPHSELVDVKQGAHDVTVEYCTDGGGAYVTDESTNGSISIAGHDCVVRWNDLRGGSVPEAAKLPTGGVKVDADPGGQWIPACAPEDGVQQCVGFGNAIYGNRIRGFDRTWRDWTGKAVFFEAYFAESIGQDVPPNVWPEDQRTICGNEYTGETHADPDASCPDWVPEGDGIGHTGGDSPWTE